MSWAAYWAPHVDMYNVCRCFMNVLSLPVDCTFALIIRNINVTRYELIIELNDLHYVGEYRPLISVTPALLRRHTYRRVWGKWHYLLDPCVKFYGESKQQLIVSHRQKYNLMLNKKNISTSGCGMAFRSEIYDAYLVTGCRSFQWRLQAAFKIRICLRYLNENLLLLICACIGIRALVVC